MGFITELEFNKLKKSKGAYYVSHGDGKVMYTLREVWTDRGYNRYTCEYYEIPRDYHIKNLAHSLKDALDKLKDFEYPVYIPNGLLQSLNDRKKHVLTEDIFNFGKYSGKSVNTVYDIDKQYLVWIGKHNPNKPFVQKYILPLVEDEIKELEHNIQWFEDQKELRKQISKHQGQIGEKISFTATVVHITGFETNYNGYEGWTTVYKFIDDKNNLYVWMTSSNPEIEKYARIDIIGTVKDHTEYKGERQTKLIRVKKI